MYPRDDDEWSTWSAREGSSDDDEVDHIQVTDGDKEETDCPGTGVNCPSLPSRWFTICRSCTYIDSSGENVVDDSNTDEGSDYEDGDSDGQVIYDDDEETNCPGS
jgi:hypothetical protein